MSTFCRVSFLPRWSLAQPEPAFALSSGLCLSLSLRILPPENAGYTCPDLNPDPRRSSRFVGDEQRGDSRPRLSDRVQDGDRARDLSNVRARAHPTSVACVPLDDILLTLVTSHTALVISSCSARSIAGAPGARVCQSRGAGTTATANGISWRRRSGSREKNARAGYIVIKFERSERALSVYLSLVEMI